MDQTQRPKLPKGITEKEIQTVLQSDAARQLLSMLNQKNGVVLRQAAAAAQNGQYEKAYEALAPLLKGTDASKLIAEIQKKHG